MKKFTSILAAATIVVALSSCGSKTAENAEATTDSVSTTTTETVTETVTTTVDSTAAVAVDTAAAK